MADIILYVLFVAVSVIKFQEKGIQRFVERRVSRFMQLKKNCNYDFDFHTECSILNQFWILLNGYFEIIYELLLVNYCRFMHE